MPFSWIELLSSKSCICKRSDQYDLLLHVMMMIVNSKLRSHGNDRDNKQIKNVNHIQQICIKNSPICLSWKSTRSNYIKYNTTLKYARHTFSYLMVGVCPTCPSSLPHRWKWNFFYQSLSQIKYFEFHNYWAGPTNSIYVSSKDRPRQLSVNAFLLHSSSTKFIRILRLAFAEIYEYPKYNDLSWLTIFWNCSYTNCN